MHQSPRILLERRIALLYGAESPAMKALDLVISEMCVEKGYQRFDGSDYYMHCIDVANFLISYGVTEQDAIVGALLHDMIEDVPGYTEEGRAKLFGKRSARYVALVSKTPGENYHDAAVLETHLARIADDVHAAAIKTADRMHNMYTLSDADIEKRYKKAVETEDYFIPFFKQCRKKYPRYESLFYAAKTQILPQIHEIKAHYADFMELCVLRAGSAQGERTDENGGFP